jgi:riboflavin synthase
MTACGLLLTDKHCHSVFRVAYTGADSVACTCACVHSCGVCMSSVTSCCVFRVAVII